MSAVLFPFAEYWWFYGVFTLFVLGLLALDLGVFHRNPHTVSFKEAASWSVVWVVLSLLFNCLLYWYALWKFPQDPRLMAIPGFDFDANARRVALEFLTGYVIEKALSVDNIFVFVVVFRFFSVPSRYQHRVLFYGILGALILRAAFITMGALLIQYHWVLLVFGAFLILTGVKMLFAPDKEVDPEKNPIYRVLRKRLRVTPRLHEGKFLVRLDGQLYATPLLLTLLFVEMTDVVFAVDSVPAIFAITLEPMIVYTSNIFAILGLRAMYFMLAGAVEYFHLLKYGLALVLIFVGLKMVWLNDLFEGNFPILVSLGIIGTLIAGSVVLSMMFPKTVVEE